MVDGCVYCRGSSDWANDHVLSEWMGCRVELANTVCATCNHEFGGGPEGKLHTLLAPIAEVCAVPEGKSSRRSRVWKAEVYGQIRRLRVSANRQVANLIHPVVQTSPLEDGRTLLIVTGTEQHDKNVRENYLSKGRPVTTVASRDYPGDFVGFFEIDIGEIFSEQGLVAASKYAANYACYALGATAPCLAFAASAYAALKGTLSPHTFVFPVGDVTLLNKLGLAPPHHTCLIAPSDRAATWVAVVALFGLFPYFVLASGVDTKLEYWTSHEFLVGTTQPAVKERRIVGCPSIPTATVTLQNPEDRAGRLSLIAQHYREALPKVARRLTGREVTVGREQHGG